MLINPRVLRISSDRHDLMGAKNKTQKKSLGLQTKPPKNPKPNFRAIKIYSRNYATGIDGKYQIILNTQKNPYLNHANPKQSRNRDFKPHKILPSSLSLEVRSTPPPPTRAINPLSPKTDQHQSPVNIHIKSREKIMIITWGKIFKCFNLLSNSLS